MARPAAPPCGYRSTDPGGVACAGRRPHRARARGAAAAPEPADVARDRRRAERVAEHDEVPPTGNLSQARRELTLRGCRGGPCAAWLGFARSGQEHLGALTRQLLGRQQPPVVEVDEL